MAANRSSRLKAKLKAKYRKVRMRKTSRLVKRRNGGRLVKVLRKA